MKYENFYSSIISEADGHIFKLGPNCVTSQILKNLPNFSLLFILLKKWLSQPYQTIYQKKGYKV